MHINEINLEFIRIIKLKSECDSNFKLQKLSDIEV